MKEREALKLALEALENHSGNYKLTKDECVKYRAVEDAIKEALAQPAVPQVHKQEPVAWTPKIERHYKDGVLIEQTIQYNPQSEKLPYPQRPSRSDMTWVGLTDEERKTISEANNMLVDDDLFDAIEAKLKEKNS